MSYEFLAERVNAMEQRLTGIEKILLKFANTSDGDASLGDFLSQLFRSTVYAREIGERVEVVENIVRGIHQSISQLNQTSSETVSRLGQLTSGLQRHGEYCDLVTTKLEASFAETQQSLTASVKKARQLQKEIDDLRLSKVDSVGLKSTLESSLADLSSQVRRLSVSEAKRQREIHGNQQDRFSPSRLRQESQQQLAGSCYLGIEVSDTERDVGVRVVRTLGNCRASCTGFREGDVITHVGDKSVRNRQDFNVTHLPVLIHLLRDGFKKQIVIDEC